MPRDLPIGNGTFHVNFDQDYNIRDIYYPNVGGFEHTLGHPSRLGIWINGNFSWLSSNDWNKSLLYYGNTLVTYTTFTNKQLNISVIVNDVIDYLENILLRKFVIKNFSDQFCHIRLFIHYDLHLSESKVGDTAYYDPHIKSIIHYKRNQYFLINCQYSASYGIDNFAIGIQDFGKAEGTWRDAEDGILSGDSVADGSVDSTMFIEFSIPENDKEIAYSWLIAGKNYNEVKSLNDLILEKSPEYYIQRTANYWKSWCKQSLASIQSSKADNEYLTKILPDNVYDLYIKSLLILQTQIDKGGAITAGNDWDTVDMGMDKYSYMWPRDGAMIAYALDKAGYKSITERFFRFCVRIITDDGYFLHKYHPDGTVGSTWHPYLSKGCIYLPIQEDGTALIVWSFWQHFKKYNDFDFLGELYESLIKKSANFMLNYRDDKTGLPLPSFDLWEERYGIHAYTVSSVHAGLKSASEIAEIIGDNESSQKYDSASKEIKKAMDEYLYDYEHKHFLRMITFGSGEYQKDYTIDSSLYSTFAFGMYDVDDPRVISTMEIIQKELSVKTKIGGIARYKNDYHFRVSDDFENVPGNPWFICNLWLAQYFIARAKTIEELSKANSILEWVAYYALDSGVLPEQLHPYTGQPLSISPLSWSHGEFIITVYNYIQKLNEIAHKD